MLDDFSVIHEDNLVSYFLGKSHFMGDRQHRHAVPGQIQYDFQHFRNHFGV